ncbi:PP2C family protein-serine/threonine phosphatase [Frankia sp. Cr2]|uniref:PP2C family protein-serine/threonine phosphatase n=1 Tax=Frankia sp. Cr2 TaxID=3073932 RepID=UPI002AD2D111|nr:PP2C family protein-serine/threonine phosphatase [Frankia sp. Cr2]
MRPNRLAKEREPQARTVRWLPLLVPLAVLVVVVGVELTDREWTILELAVLCPMLSATLTGPRLTAVYGVAAVVTGALLGIHDGLYQPRYGGPLAQLVRLAGITAGAVIAVMVSRYHTRREAKLHNVTQVAQAAQQTILSSVPPALDGLRLAVRYESATAEAAVGGDLYDILDSPWGIRILVGDVRGKGLGAVWIASRVLGCFRTVARRTKDLSAIIADLDAEVAEVGGLDDFVTAIVAQIHDGQLTLANAGHPDPVVLHSDTADLVTVPLRAPPLGLAAGAAGRRAVTLLPGDRLLLYTDGLAEARHPVTGEFFPLLDAARDALGSANLDTALAELARYLHLWAGAHLDDDVALLLVEIPRAGTADATTRRR